MARAKPKNAKFGNSIPTPQESRDAVVATQDRLALALEAISGVMYDFDATRGTTIRSARLYELLGFHPSEVAEDVSWWNDRIHPEDKGRVNRIFEESDAHCQVEYRIQHRDGHYVHIWDHALIVRDKQGVMQRVVGSNLNISQYKEVEEVLNKAYMAERDARQAAEQTARRLTRLQRITHSFSQALTTDQIAGIVIDELCSVLKSARGMLFMCAPKAESLTLLKSRGLDQPENQHAPAIPLDADLPFCKVLRSREATPLKGEPFNGQKHPEFSCFFPQNWQTTLLSLPLISGGNSSGVIVIEVKPSIILPEEEQQLLRIISLQCAQALDRARLYESEMLARTQAEAANQAKDQFFATISHELRSPLQSILGWVKLTRAGKLDVATSAKALEVIERNTRSQVQLVADMLEVSRIVTGKISMSSEILSLTSTIEVSLDSIRPTAINKGVNLLLDIEPDLPLIWGDQNRLQQVFWNLLSNAVKFTPKDGSITVTAQSNGGMVEIAVTDTGEGISPEFLPHVFERFSQSNEIKTRIHGGLGLGLAIVRHIVELHGGKVRVDSPGSGKGTTFSISLPAHSDTRMSNVAKVKRRTGSLEGVKILVVEDSNDTREFLATVLQSEGAEVEQADCVSSGIRMIEAFSPEILLSDIGMPGSDGHELIKEVRTCLSERELPAAALSAYTTPDDARRSLSAGFQMHLCKPIEPDALIKAVRGLLQVRKEKSQSVLERFAS